MMSNQKLMNTKVSQLIKIYKLYLDHFIILESGYNT
jgi:hypothetical protein